MKKLFKKLFGGPTESTQETKSFIYIEQLSSGSLKVTVSENTTDQDLLNITSKYYNEVVNPIYLEVQHKKRVDMKAKQLVNSLVNNVEGVTFSKYD